MVENLKFTQLDITEKLDDRSNLKPEKGRRGQVLTFDMLYFDITSKEKTV
jgi:hypothetical protein